MEVHALSRDLKLWCEGLVVADRLIRPLIHGSRVKVAPPVCVCVCVFVYVGVGEECVCVKKIADRRWWWWQQKTTKDGLQGMAGGTGLLGGDNT